MGIRTSQAEAERTKSGDGCKIPPPEHFLWIFMMSLQEDPVTHG